MHSRYVEHKAYLDREMITMKNATVVGSPKSWALRWHNGPCWFEKYNGGDEPMPTTDGPFRMVMWQMYEKRNVAGWKPSATARVAKRTGHTFLEADYKKKWSAHARRHLRNWETHTDWEVVPMTLEQFIREYKKAPKDPILKFLFSRFLRQKAKGHGAHMRVWGARERGTNRFPAGFVSIDVPECKQSGHLLSYIHKRAKPTDAGYALMDVWFADSLAKGFEVLDFGLFWAPGDPKQWQGFSRFKSQFVDEYIDYPLPIVKWVGSWRENFRHLANFLPRMSAKREEGK